MKKYLSIALVGILILSGFGAVVINGEQKEQTISETSSFSKTAGDAVSKLSTLEELYNTDISDNKPESKYSERLIDPIHDENIVSIRFSFNEPVIKKTEVDEESFHNIKLDDLYTYKIPGEPMLPYKSFSTILEAGRSLDYIEVLTGTKNVMDGVFLIEPGQKLVPTLYDMENKGVVTDSDEFDRDLRIYESSEAYPSSLFQDVSLQFCKGYEILTININPAQYQPAYGVVWYYDEIILNIHTKPSDGNAGKNFRGLENDKQSVSLMVDEGSAIQSYPLPASPAYSPGTFTYVIITTEEYQDEFQNLVDWKQNRGSSTQFSSLSACVVLLEDIVTNPDYWWDGIWGDGGNELLFNDTQCKIRNFIKMAYNEWNTEYVLLGGDADVDNPVIPHRGMYVYQGMYTDFDIPCDMYYGCLDGNWDDDMDGTFGEANPEDEADLYAEVYIGRAPVDSLQEAENFVSKTIAYEQAVDNNAVYLKDALMIGTNLDGKTEGGNSKDLVTEEIPQYTTKKAYDRDGTYSKEFILEEMQNDVHIVNHVGHANVNVFTSGIGQGDIAALTNNNFFLVYTIGCYSASFDNRGNPGYYYLDDSVGEYFVTSSGGSFAYIGNSRYGWYSPGSTNGPGARYDMSFFNTLMNDTASLGKALQHSKENLFTDQGYLFRWTYYALNLLGDPETQIKKDFTSPTAHFDIVDDYLLTPPVYRGVVDIAGIAKRGDKPGSTFSNYVIEYGAGTDPSEWSNLGVSLINNGYTQVTDGMLATWDTGLTVDGTYTLRLTVYSNSGVVSRDWFVVIVDNVDIIYPYDNSFLRAGEIIDICGYADGTNFQHYAIEYGEGKNPSSWSTEGITLTNGGNTPVIDDVLAVWDTSYITSNNYYTLRIVTNYSNHDNIDTKTLVFDPDFKEGWPKRITTYQIYGEGVGVGDVDQDGFKEIFTGVDTPCRCKGVCYGWNYDGIPLEGWPISNTIKPVVHMPAIGDIDGDGDLEIVCASYFNYKLYAWHHNGSLVSGFPLKIINGYISDTVTLEDIDNNGDLEIIVITYKSYNNRLFVFNHTGLPYSPMFPIMIDGYPLGSPVVGDLDGDGTSEIIVTLWSGNVTVIHHNGSVMQGWPKNLGDIIWSPPVLADFDNDGSLEIVVSTMENLYVFHYNGTNYSGWPIPHTGTSGSIAIADLECDGSLEIIVEGQITGGFSLTAFHDDGTIVEGSWPILFDSSDSIYDRSSVIGDIDGDHDKEILLAYGYDTFNAWHHNGSVVNGWPKIKPMVSTSIQAFCSPVLADIDGDNNIEIILAEYDHVLVWNLNEKCLPIDVEWGSFQHDRYNTGNYNRQSPDISIVFVDDDFNESTVGWNITRFNTIQGGVNNADVNGTVYVFGGNYVENVVVNKPITLKGEGEANTKITAMFDSEPAVSVYANNVNFNGFTVTGATDDGVAGIYLDDVSSCTISGNNVSGNNVGICFIDFSLNNMIYNNIFNNVNNAYDTGVNVWNIIKTCGENVLGGPYLGGNYWSDYTGIDIDGDGLGDTPYNVSEGGNQDDYPLMGTCPVPNDPPVAVNDIASTPEDVSVDIDVTYNDYDIDGSIDLRSVVIVDDVSHGVTSVDSSTGVVTYTPDLYYFGSDSFTYVVDDDDGDTSNVAMVTITVTEENAPPTSADNTVSALEDIAYTFLLTDFAFSDLDVGDQLEYVKITQLESDGSLKLDGVDVLLDQEISRADIIAGKLTFSSDLDENGIGYANFNFKVSDGLLYSISSYTMTVDVTSVNDPPASADNTVSTLEDTAYTFLVGDFPFSDVEGDSLSHVKVTVLECVGDLTWDGFDVVLDNEIPVADIADGKLVFTPCLNGNGADYDIFDFMVKDGVDYSVVDYMIIVDVAAVNDPPVANDDSVTTSEDVGIVIDVLANDSDPDYGDVLSLDEIISGPSSGTAEIIDGDVVYVPNPDFNGVDIFTYEISDSEGMSDTADVTISIVSDNDPPVALFVFKDTDGNEITGCDEGAVVTIDGSESFDPEDGEDITYQWIGPDGIDIIDVTAEITSFTAPEGLPANEVFEFALIVSDPDEATGTTYEFIIVNSNNNQNITVTYNLVKGMNYISFNFIPESMAIEDILVPLLESDSIAYVLADQKQGGFFMPAWNYNSIGNNGNIEVCRGYKIKMKEAATLTVSGEPLSGNIVLDLVAGANFVSFLNDTSAQERVEDLFESGSLFMVFDPSLSNSPVYLKRLPDGAIVGNLEVFEQGHVYLFVATENAEITVS